MSGPLLDLALADAITGPLELELSLQPPVDVAAVAELRAFIEDFVTIADAGAFVTERNPPTTAGFSVVAESNEPAGFRLSCNVANLDGRFIRVLRNLTVMFTHVTHPVRTLRARSPGARPSTLPELGTLSLEAAYPPMSGQLGIAVNLDADGDHRGPRYAELSFASGVPDPQADAILRLFEAWGNVALGGYAETEAELQSGDCAIFDAQPDLRDDATIEVSIGSFGAPRCAWNSFSNLCGTVHQTMASMLHLEIT